MPTKPHPLSYHTEQVLRLKGIITAENAKIDSELAAATSITENFADTLPPGGTEAAMAAEIRRIALLGLRERVSSNLNFHHEQTTAAYYKSEALSVTASAEMELEELVRNLPKMKESFFDRIATLTREALGLPSIDRAAKFAARDAQEDALLYLESLVDKSKVDIARFSADPSPVNFNGIAGTLAMLRHELSKAASTAA